MDERYLIRLVNVLRPLPWVRELTKVAAFAEIPMILIALADANIARPADFRLVEEFFWRRTLTDIAFCLATILCIWFTAVIAFAGSRLYRYWQAEKMRVRLDVMWLLSPWLYLALIPLTVALWINARNENLNLAIPWTPFEYGRPPLSGLIMAELAALFALKIPMLTPGFSPVLAPRSFWRLIRASLAISLGPGAGNQLVAHAREVVDFAGTYAAVEWQEGTENPEIYRPYTDAETLAVFQDSLSCLFETAIDIAKEIVPLVKGRTSWTLADIGGGEGRFTSNLVSHCLAPPSLLLVVEPDAKSIEQYCSRFAKHTPKITVQPHTSTMQDAVIEMRTFDVVLASHSLYSVADQHNDEVLQILGELHRKARLRFIAIMASRDSAAYKVKRAVLTYLGLRDISTFGEDFLVPFASDLDHTTATKDSIINVTDILLDDRRLVAWVAYFCRVSPISLTEHVDVVRRLIEQNACRIGSLPLLLRDDLRTRGVLDRLMLSDDSNVLFHKEIIISAAPAETA